MLRWESCSSMFVCIPNSPFFSFSRPFFFHAVPKSYLPDGLDKGHLPKLTITCFGSSGWISYFVGPEMFWRKPGQERSVKDKALHALADISFNRTSVSMLVVFDAVCRSVSFCCAFFFFLFLFFFFFFLNQWWSDFQSLQACFIFGFSEMQYNRLPFVWPRYTP